MLILAQRRFAAAASLFLAAALLVLSLPSTSAAATVRSVVPVSGDFQSVAISADFRPLKAQARSESGAILPTTKLRFVIRGNTEATFAGGYKTSTVYTDSTGHASPTKLNAGPIAGDFTVDVMFLDENFEEESVGGTFHATVVGDPPVVEELRISGGNNQQLPVGAQFGELAVVAERGGKPVAEVDVTFAIDDPEQTGVSFGGGLVHTARTGADGLASARVDSGAQVGVFTVTATSSLGSVAFTGVVTDPVVRYLSVVGGAHQQADMNGAFPKPIVARVTDGRGDPVAGQRVDFVVGNDLIFFEGNTLIGFAISDTDGLATAPALNSGGNPGSSTVIGIVNGSAVVRFSGLEILPSKS